MSKIMRMIKKFWWIILIILFFYYSSDPSRKSKMLKFLSDLPVIGPMVIKMFPTEESNEIALPPDQSLVKPMNQSTYSKSIVK